MRKRCLLGFWLGWICLLSPTLQAAEHWLLLTTPTMQRLAPLFSSRLAEAGIQADIRLVPQARLLAELAQPGVDGAFLLTELVTKTVPGVEPVPVALHQYELMAVTRQAASPIRRPADLAHHRVGLVRGSQLSEQVSRGLAHVYRVRSDEALVAAFAANRFDVILLARDLVAGKMSSAGVTDYRVQEPPLASKPLFLLVSSRHKAMLPALTRIFLQAQQHGRWQQEVKAVMRP